MRTEGGSFIKSPWYYRTGIRPIGATPYMEVNLLTTAVHALTIRATVTATSTLMIQTTSFAGLVVIVAAGTAADRVQIGLYKGSQTLPIAMAQQYSNGTGSIQQNQGSYIGDVIAVSGESMNIATVDARGGAGSAQYKAALGLEYFGR